MLCCAPKEEEVRKSQNWFNLTSCKGKPQKQKYPHFHWYRNDKLILGDYRKTKPILYIPSLMSQATDGLRTLWIYTILQNRRS